MAPLLEDPRIRQTWNNISHNAETVTETAATGVWQFAHNYINPCFVSIGDSLAQCTTQCFPTSEERARRLRERERARGRAEYSFDFYDDWDTDITNSNSRGLLGWGNDEMDRLLAGSGSLSHVQDQPSGRKRKMSYGTRAPKRKGTIDGLPDPTIIPSTSKIGFLQRLPFKFGGTLRYKPSAADLQDNPGAHRAELGNDEEVEPMIEEGHSDNEAEQAFDLGRNRPRSNTTGSGATSDSFRSRGDLFPSDGEDDAVPLSDEFAMNLTTTRSGPDDRSSGTTRSSKGKRPGDALSRTRSRTSQSSSRSLAALSSLGEPSPLGLERSNPSISDSERKMVPPMSDLEKEEERVKKDEEDELRMKRKAADRLAMKRGLSFSSPSTSSESESVAQKEMIRTTSSVRQSTSHPASIRSKTKSNPDASVEQVQPSNSASRLALQPSADHTSSNTDASDKGSFVPARLPQF